MATVAFCGNFTTYKWNCNIQEVDRCLRPFCRKFYVGCFSFKCTINFLSFSSPCSKRKKMSSIYLHHKYGSSSILLKISSSNAAINNILYGGANFVPIAVHRFCFKVFSLKVKILFLRTTSASSTNVKVVKSPSCLKSSRLRKADRPLLCGMLGYKPTTSTVHKIMSSDKFGKERSFFKKSVVSFM